MIKYTIGTFSTRRMFPGREEGKVLGLDFFELMSEPHAGAFSLFGTTHILLLFFSAGIICLVLHWVSGQGAARQERAIQSMAVLVPVLEISHAVWLYQAGVKELDKLLPLHLCGMQSVFIPLAVFSRRQYWQDYVYATSVLGGVFALLFQSGVADYYPFWHFQTLQNIALHLLLILVPVSLILTGRHRPHPARFPVSVGIFLGVAVLAGVVDWLGNENYMFLAYPPLNTPLVWVYQVLGHGGYLVVAFLLLAGMSLLLHLPFLRTEGRAERAARQQG